MNENYGSRDRTDSDAALALTHTERRKPATVLKAVVTHTKPSKPATVLRAVVMHTEPGESVDVSHLANPSGIRREKGGRCDQISYY
jgi:hypothetical protein